MSRISVYVRLRPLLQNQVDQRLVKQRIHFNQQNNQISVELSQKRQKVFKFDGLLNDQASQDQVYDCINMKSLVQRVIDGYHSTIFAYGQTGSGKTFTIEGQNSNSQNIGLVPRSIKQLFRQIKQKETQNPTLSYKVNISFLQIYNEQIYDLIDINKTPLKMRWNKYQQFIVQDLFEGQCRDENDAINWWKKGQKSKIIDSHNMNKESSRSHCIFTLKIRCYQLQDPSNCVQSKLQIVDLAGSQRQKVTKSTGIVFREGIEINKSLFSLRQVIAALYQSNTGTKSQSLPPYRDSKLTSLLKQSIGGNAYCVMIACINPTLPHFEQSLQTLTYASMATYINNAPSRNIDPKIKQNQLLKQQNYNLKEQIKKLSSHIEYLTNLLQKNNCQKCGSINTIKLQNIDLKMTKTGNRRILQTEESQNFRLPKFNTSDSKIVKKPIVSTKDTGMNETQSKYFKRGSFVNRQQRSLTINSTKNGMNSSDYQLKNPKQILQSITMIRDLINTNTKLRDKIQIMRQQNQKMQKQTFQIMQQNQLLRQRWQMLGSNLKVDGLNNQQNEAPISLYQRLLRQQKGQSLLYIGNNSDKMEPSINMDTKKYKSVQRQGQDIESRQNERFKAYRPYNQIFKSGSKRKKQQVNRKTRNTYNSMKKSDSLIN